MVVAWEANIAASINVDVQRWLASALLQQITRRAARSHYFPLGHEPGTPTHCEVGSVLYVSTDDQSKAHPQIGVSLLGRIKSLRWGLHLNHARRA